MKTDILTALLMMAPRSSLEVEMTMQDGSVIKVNLDVEQIRSEIQEAKRLADKAVSLERENVQLEKMAAWLANQITFCAGYNRIIPCTDGCPICDKQRTARDWLESARQAATEET